MLPCGSTPPASVPGVDRHPGLVGRHDRVAAPGVQVAHVLGVRRELRARPPRRTSGKLSSCITVGTSAAPRSRPSRRSGRRTARCRARCSRCRPSIRPGSDRLAEAVRGDLGAVLVRDPRSPRRRRRPGSEGARSPDVAVDPVADQLDPAVAALRLLGDVRRRARPARPRGRSCGCSAWSGRCAGRPGSAAAGPRGRRSSGCRRPTRSRAAAARPRRGRRSPAPRWSRRRRRRSASSPTWQWASTSPGTIQPSADGLGARDWGS